jgi:hypothetical protein
MVAWLSCDEISDALTPTRSRPPIEAELNLAINTLVGDTVAEGGGRGGRRRRRGAERNEPKYIRTQAGGVKKNRRYAPPAAAADGDGD